MDILKWKNKYAIDCDSNYPSVSTRKTYKYCVNKFLTEFKEEKEPKAIPTEKIKVWLLTFHTLNTRKQMLCSVNSFYSLTVGMPKKVKRIPYPKQPDKLPQVIDRDYLVSSIENIRNLKHKALLMIGYGCGLRVSEVVNLEMSNIDRKRMLIHVMNGKGLKDRIVVLSDNVLLTLEQYAKAYRPTKYLFNGQKAIKYTAQSCNKVVKKYLGETHHYHQLRHSYATALLESGVDISLIQKLMGHKKLETTQIYTRVTSTVLSKLKMPM